MSDARAPTRAEEGRYTVVYKGDPAGNRILNGEPAVGRAVGVMLGDLIERAAQAEAEVVRLTQERDEALCLAEGPSTLLDLARGSVSRGMELHAAEAEVARLTAALAEAERERDEARTASVLGWLKTYGKDTLADFTARTEAAEASASALRERVATLEAEMDRLRKDNERLRWRHPAVLPDWNDLPDGLRAKLAKTADGYDPDWGCEIAVNMYAALRQAMMEALHADN